jgi:hypothetical protein
MKRKMAISAVAALVTISICVTWFYLTQPVPAGVDGAKLIAAAEAYARDLRAHGQAMPESVELHDLLAKGWLQADDVKGFAGMEVTISLTVDESHPQDVMMRVRMQDGSEVVTLADGSVQSVARK